MVLILFVKSAKLTGCRSRRQQQGVCALQTNRSQNCFPEVPVGNFLQDVSFSFRQMVKNPGFTIAAVLCIALGIGANTATFSFANSILMYDSPAREPDRLARLFIHWASGLEYGSWSWPDYESFRDRSDVIEGLVAERPQPVHVSRDGDNSRLWAMVVSGNYFSELGIDLALGRGFNPEEYATRGTHAVIVLSHSLWQNRFGADPEILGSEITVNNHPFTIIGVTQEGFTGTNVGFAPEVWVTFMMNDVLQPDFNMLDARGSHGIQFVTARLKPGVTIEQADESFNALMTQLFEEFPDTNEGKRVDVYAESQANLHPMVRGGFVGFIAVMFGVVGLILLLACANVAGLVLARSAARSREIGIRMSLGASRWRLVRQLLTESLMLALVAGAIGLLLGFWLVRLIATFEPPTDLPIAFSINVDTRVLAFTFIATVLTGAVFGLAPTLQTSRQDLAATVKEGALTGASKSSFMRRLLVVGKVALSLILLVGAALAIRSLQAVGDLDLGFEPDNLAIASVDLDMQGYDEAGGRQFQRELRERLAAHPGVTAVGMSDVIPLNFMSNSSGVLPEGYEVPEDSIVPIVDRAVVDADYFDAMGIPVLRGRAFTEADDADAPAVMIVNETFAERYWPGEEPVGKWVRTNGRDFEVIGIVKNGKYFSIGEDPKPHFYRSRYASYSGASFILVRSTGDPNALLEVIRREVGAMDETLPVANLQPMTTALGIAFFPARLAATVVSGFAVLALLLAAVGLYGVIAFTVSQGTRDIGIRMALGAQGSDVLALVVRQGMVLTVIGLAIGLAGGLALTRLMSVLLYGVTSTDIVSYLGASVLLAAVATLASFIPARRATRVDPLIALRAE